MEIDTIGTFAMSRAAFPAMRQRGGGRVVNISATLHYGATWWQVLPTVARALTLWKLVSLLSIVISTQWACACIGMPGLDCAEDECIA